MRVWLVRAGKESVLENRVLETGYALIGWDELPDLTDLEETQISQLVAEHYKEKKDHQVQDDTRQIVSFMREIKKNDIFVLLLKRKPPRKFRFGIFTGDYEYLPENPQYGGHGRQIKWVSSIIPQSKCHEGLLEPLKSNYNTVIEINDNNAIEWIKKVIDDYQNDGVRKHGLTDNESENEKLRKKINMVLAEYDEIGEKEFLKKHRYKKSTKYWIRSAKPNHENYVSKAVAGVATDRYVDYGGWQIENSACTVLFNSGFIIVDKDDKTYTEIDARGGVLAVPDEVRCLVSEEERLPLVLLNYYIEPVADRNEELVAVNVNEFHEYLGFNNKHTLLHQVLSDLENKIDGISLIEKIGGEGASGDVYNFKITENFGDIEIIDTTIKEYDIDSIRKDGCFLSKNELEIIYERLESRKNIILQGPPGTGKTWLAKRLAYALVGAKDKSKILSKQFHPNLSYEDFIRGWRPEKEGKLALIDGAFLKMVNKAKSDPSSKYVIVIEEINRGNPAQIFGEMLTLLEGDKRNVDESIELTYIKEDAGVYIPDNLYVIGTMNLADRSLARIDLALRRRFAFAELQPIFKDSWRNWVQREFKIEKDVLEAIELRLNELNAVIEKHPDLGKHFKIGHSYFTPSSKIEFSDHWQWFYRIVDYEIKPLLEEYWFDSPSTAETEYLKLRDGS